MSDDLVRYFIELFLTDWENTEGIDGFKKLSNTARETGESWLASIAEARLASWNGNHEEALNLLEPLLTGDSPNPFALLMRARILCNDVEDYPKSLQDFNRFINEYPVAGELRDWMFALALIGRGFTTAISGKQKEALEIYSDIVKKFGGSQEIKTEGLVAKALIYRGATLGQLNCYKEEIETYDELIIRFGERKELTLAEPVVRAMVNKGVALSRLNNHKEAISVYDEVVKKFGERAELELLRPVAEAMVNKGIAYGILDNHKEAISAYEEVENRFGERKELTFTEPIARALINKGVTLGQQKKYEEAISVYDDVVERAEKHKPVLIENVAMALFNKVAVLRDMGDLKGVLQLLRGIKEKFSKIEPETSGFWLDFFTRVPRRIVDISDSNLEKDVREVVEWCLEKIKSDDQANLSVHLAEGLKYIDEEKQNEFFKAIDIVKRSIDSFIKGRGRFNPDMSFFLVLREWNSYTPALPAQEEADRGGGYFLRHGGEGIVIDPGYDFIDNFARAGGRLRDIQHIIVTHAHDDHTANLEPLLMLFHRLRNLESSEITADTGEEDEEICRNTRVSLYLSESVQRKFSGLLELNDPMFRRNVTLTNPKLNDIQLLHLNEKTTLTALPAYHDDVISMEHAVGFILDCRLNDGSIRRIVFTGDTGLYPRLLDEQGTPVYHTYKDSNNKTRKEPALDDSAGKALFERYEAILDGLKPDLLVAHIGSIKKQEFASEDLTYEELERHFKPSRRFYVNHLGLLGTLLLTYKLLPRAVVISEFGSELKHIRIELVCRLADALHSLQKADDPKTDKTFVTPGDLTTIYNIETHQFLCHSQSTFKDPYRLEIVPASNFRRDLNNATQRYDALPQEDFERSYLFPIRRRRAKAGYNLCAQEFFRKLFNCQLPIHKKK